MEPVSLQIRAFSDTPQLGHSPDHRVSAVIMLTARSVWRHCAELIFQLREKPDMMQSALFCEHRDRLRSDHLSFGGPHKPCGDIRINSPKPGDKPVASLVSFRDNTVSAEVIISSDSPTGSFIGGSPG